MLSAVISSKLSYPAVPLARQLVHQSNVPPGPLVLGRSSITIPAPTADRSRTVSRRSEPNSRTTLIGEQPNPWDLLQPQDVMSRHRGAKPPRRYELLGEISLLSPAYLLSVGDGPSTRSHRITMTDFRLCSTCRCHSQAGFSHCTLHLISDQIEPTIARLRYTLGGDRPSQTTRHTGSQLGITKRG